MTRKAPKMTIEEFQSLLPIHRLSDLDAREPSVFPIVKKDWAKVDFSLENIIVDDPDPYRYVGFHTLDTGLTFLGLMCGGDWEFPVFAIIYHDGKKFRGYVPNRGNAFHHDVKAAYGSHPDDPGEDFEYDEILEKIDNDAILDDIRNRIMVTDSQVKTVTYSAPVGISVEDLTSHLNSDPFTSSDIYTTMSGKITIHSSPFTHGIAHGIGWTCLVYWDGKAVVERPVYKAALTTPLPGVARSSLGGSPSEEDIQKAIQALPGGG